VLGPDYKRSQELDILNSMKLQKLLRQFIRESIGRNYHTIDTSPHTFDDFQDYDTEIDGAIDGSIYMTIFYKGEKIFPTQRFSTFNDAHHHSRVVIDKDRVYRMNNEKKDLDIV
jgi:hypothetical protein